MAHADSSPWGALPAAIAGFDESGVSTAVLSGPQHLVTALNASARSLVGNRDPWGKPLHQAMPELVPAEWADQLDRVYTSGEAFVGHEWRAWNEDELGHLSEAYFTFMLTAWHDEQGAVGGVISQGVDVTAEVLARKQSEARARTLESHFDTARSLVRAIRDVLLPDDLPIVRGLDIDARYVLATHGDSGGGDWFDAVVRPDGSTALVVGDIVGRGATASAVMGQLRAVLHERLAGPATLAEALTDLDRFAALRPETSAATVCVVVIDPDSGRAEYVTAGHPAPLVVNPDGRHHYLEPTGGRPLGTGGEVTVGTASIGVNDLVLLYTDGLVRGPHRQTPRDQHRLATVVAESVVDRALDPEAPRRAAERACQLTLESLTGSHEHLEDIAVLAAQRVPAIAPLQLDLPADLAASTQVRTQIGMLLSALDVRHLDEIAVQHGVGEIVTNAVEHAAATSRTGRICVEAELDRSGWLVLSVTDTGHWPVEVDTGGTRGRGLATATGFLDEVRTEVRPEGTVVHVRHRLTRLARLLSRPRTLRVLPDPEHAEILVEDTRRIRVTGPVDLADTDELSNAVRVTSRGGSTPVLVDLGGVTHLGSAAVQTLFELRGLRTREGHRAVWVHAPKDSPAGHVLELVRMPFETEDPGDPA